MSSPHPPAAVDPTPPRTATRWLWATLRIVVAAAGVGYIAWTVNWRPYVDTEGVERPGFVQRLAEADPAWLLAGLACLLPIVPLAAWRWTVLLHGLDIRIPGRAVLRLTWVGQFFNYAVPVGTTGGDVLRAVVAARWAGHGQKTPAVLSLLADRAAGLAGLVTLAGLVGLTRLDDPIVRRVVVVAGVVLGAGVLALLLYAWPAARRRLGIDRMATWPGVGRLIEVAEAYRRVAYRPVIAAVGISVLIHATLTGGAVCAGLALGLDAPVGRVFATMPVAFAAAAVPLTYQGLGVMEAVAVALIGGGAAQQANAVIGLLLIHRLYLLVVALPGAWGLVGLRGAGPTDNPASANDSGSV